MATDDLTPDFYLASSEGYCMMEEPRKAYRIKRLRGERRDDYLLIRIDPPLIGKQYGRGAGDIDQVVVATRHRGDSLFPMREWPVFVHVALPLVDAPQDRDTLRKRELEEIAWAALYWYRRCGAAEANWFIRQQHSASCAGSSALGLAKRPETGTANLADEPPKQ